MHRDIAAILVRTDMTIQQVIERLDQSKLGIVLVVDDGQHLQGTITDGDIRRALLAKLSLESPVARMLDMKRGTVHERPLTASDQMERAEYLRLLQQHALVHLPLLNDRGQVVALVTREDFVGDTTSRIQTVIMAGGRGERLYPLTEDLPKPMLPVGDKPILEIIIGKLKEAGLVKVHISTHHKREIITDYFGNGQKFGVDISYVAEDKPLGTAGAIGFVEDSNDTMLVINGDILTHINFKAMLQFHREHAADLTMAVRSYAMKVPYGVVECEGVRIQNVEEKPDIHVLVNAGIYLLEPHVRAHIPTGKHCNMTDLVQRLVADKQNVVSFPIHEYWLDIGERADYLRAQKDAKA